MKILLFILISLYALSNVVSDDKYLSITNLMVVKRNKASCQRLGNIYDACQWMLKFTLNNKTSNNLISFCSVIKINDEKYKLCSNKLSKKYYTAANKSKIVLTNLSELIGYENDNAKPRVRISELKGKFSKL